MNILFFTHHLNQGGAEKTVRTLSEYFNTHALGVKSYLCVIYDDPDLKPYPQNVIVMQHRSDSQDSRFSKGWNVLAQIREMRQIKKSHAIDVCISFLPGADIINVLSGVGEKEIVSVRNIESLFVHSVFKKWYVKVAYLKCDYIIACSETVRRDCIDFFKVPEQKIATIYNAATQMQLTGHTLTEFQDFEKNHFVFINVGRLAPEKGQLHLLRAFADFCKEAEFARGNRKPGLVLVGDGELFEPLRQMSMDLGISDHVLFCGRQANPADYMRASDVFVLSSNMEGMPNVLVEALQNGLPCIATECGAREILAPETDPISDRTERVDLAEYGILVPVCGTESNDDLNWRTDIPLSGREKTLSEAMRILYTDKKMLEKYRNQARCAINSISVEAISNLWLNVIRKIVHG
ncbi:MAG: glycosyltransferase [Lachnospiraceae bacterium]|nr:glycosyltransferase [Lachnospiraceae bacterium]